MKRAIWFISAILFMLMTCALSEESNLYSTERLLSLKPEISVNNENEICINVEYDANAGDRYYNLFHEAVDDLAPGDICRVEYEISVDSAVGDSFIILDSLHNAQFSQLYTENRTVGVSKTGTITGSYYTTASAIPEEQKNTAVLMRTYVYVRQDASLNCKIKLAVYKVDSNDIPQAAVDEVSPLGQNVYACNSVSLNDTYGTKNSDGSFTISIDNTAGTQDRYGGFNHESVTSVVCGEIYKVEYKITVEEIESNCYIILDSQNARQHSQLYHKDKTVSTNKTGTISGSYTVTANERPTDNSIQWLLMRSYVYVPAGSSIRCTIEISVSRIKAYYVTLDVPESFKLTGYDSSLNNYEQGNQLRYTVSAEEGALYTISVIDAENNEIDYAYHGGELSFTMPASSVTVRVQEHLLSCLCDGQEIRLKSIGENNYLLLPASADYSALSLHADLIIAGEAEGRTIEISSGTAVDITTLFEHEMQAGELYELKIYSGDKYINTVKLMKADCLKTLYLTSDIGIEVLNQNKENCGKGTLSLFSDTGDMIIENTVMTGFHGRGNTSWYFSGDKKSYTIKLEKKAELIENAGKAKGWCLITDNCGGKNVDWVHEAPGLANLTMYELYRQIGGAYAIDCEMINLYINGWYHGTYLLTEKVEIGKKRVNITETKFETEDKTERTQVRASQETEADKPKQWSVLSADYIADENDPAIKAGIQAYQYATNSVISSSGGFLLELDRNFASQASWFVTKRGYPYSVKEPEYASREQVQKIAIYMQELEDAVFAEYGYNAAGRYYTDYLDLDAVAVKMLIECVTTQTDAYITSFFMTIDTDENGIDGLGKVKFGPAWDYDGTNLHTSFSGSAFMSKNGSAEGITNQKELANKLFSHGELAAVIKAISDTALKAAFEDQTPLENDGNGGKMDANISMLENSQKMNMLLYPNTEDDVNPTDDFAGFKQQFISRYQKWYSKIFTDDCLEGLTLINHGSYIEAIVVGTADSVSWYRVDLDTGNMVRIDGADGYRYSPECEGIYCAAATGKCVYDTKVNTMYASIAFECR